MHVTGQNILISGISRGLGLHLATRLLEGGNRVAGFSRSATAETDALAARFGRDFRFSALDAADEAAVSAMVREVAQGFGGIDSLVNNAALGQDHLLIHAAPEDIRRLIEVNITAPTLLTRAVARQMLLAGKGNILSISSICGSRGFAGLSAYAGSKGYLDAMTRALARELGEAGIRVNAIAPGFFASEMSAVLRPEQLETIRRRTPSGRLSEAEDIWRIVDLVLSGKANIHGQVLTVDGGLGS